MVYLVDDDIDDIALVHEAFQRNNFAGKIASAHNGEEFLHQLQKSQSDLPELIVLDLNMPLKDGFQVLAALKSSQHFASIPVVVLTASSNRQDEVRCRQLGCSLFFQKPSRFADYDRVIKAILDFMRKGAEA